jgi:hypothetical protein
MPFCKGRCELKIDMFIIMENTPEQLFDPHEEERYHY